jgi:hypothetical protein
MHAGSESLRLPGCLSETRLSDSGTRTRRLGCQCVPTRKLGLGPAEFDLRTRPGGVKSTSIFELAIAARPASLSARATSLSHGGRPPAGNHDHHCRPGRGPGGPRLAGARLDDHGGRGGRNGPVTDENRQ